MSFGIHAISQQVTRTPPPPRYFGRWYGRASRSVDECWWRSNAITTLSRIYSLMPVPIILASYFMFHFNFTIICPQIVRSTFLSRLKREGGDSSASLTRLKDSNRATAIDRFMSRLYQDQLRKFR